MKKKLPDSPMSVPNIPVPKLDQKLGGISPVMTQKTAETLQKTGQFIPGLFKIASPLSSAIENTGKKILTHDTIAKTFYEAGNMARGDAESKLSGLFERHRIALKAKAPINMSGGSDMAARALASRV